MKIYGINLTKDNFEKSLQEVRKNTNFEISDNNNFFIAIDDWFGNGLNNENKPILFSGRLYKSGILFESFLEESSKIIPKKHLKKGKKFDSINFPIKKFIRSIKEKTPNNLFFFQRPISAVKKTSDLEKYAKEFLSKMNLEYNKKNQNLPIDKMEKYFNPDVLESNVLLVFFEHIINYIRLNVMNNKTFRISFLCDRMSWQSKLDDKFIANKGSITAPMFNYKFIENSICYVNVAFFDRKINNDFASKTLLSIADIENQFYGSRYQQRKVSFEDNNIKKETSIFDFYYYLCDKHPDSDTKDFDSEFNSKLNLLLEEVKICDYPTYLYVKYFIDGLEKKQVISLPIRTNTDYIK
jgi:hypothetical protein